MTRYILPILLLSVFSCTSNTQDQETDWKLRNTEDIFHSEKGNEKTQVIYSTQHTGTSRYTDTSIVVQQYMDTLLLEEISYNVEDGDTIKWSHTVNRYNSDGLLVEEIDSTNGRLMHHVLKFYQNSKLQRSESLYVIPNYNDKGELTAPDTARSIIYPYYDSDNRLVSGMTLTRDELSFQLAGITKFDTTFFFYQFDSLGNNIRSIGIVNGDTTSLTMSEYDELHREVKLVMASLDLGIFTTISEYDDRGNIISQHDISEAFSILTLTEFDEQNRPVIQKIYEPKNSY